MGRIKRANLGKRPRKEIPMVAEVAAILKVNLEYCDWEVISFWHSYFLFSFYIQRKAFEEELENFLTLRQKTYAQRKPKRYDLEFGGLSLQVCMGWDTRNCSVWCSFCVKWYTSTLFKNDASFRNKEAWSVLCWVGEPWKWQNTEDIIYEKPLTFLNEMSYPAFICRD